MGDREGEYSGCFGEQCVVLFAEGGGTGGGDGLSESGMGVWEAGFVSGV